jgi:hypothetical protein
MADLESTVKSGDRRASLIALRDYLAHELEVHRCDRCKAFQLRTGDTAALVLRLQKVMEEIEAMPDTNAEVTELDLIRARRNGTSATSNIQSSGLGTKNGPRRQGGRAASGTREFGA